MAGAAGGERRRLGAEGAAGRRQHGRAEALDGDGYWVGGRAAWALTMLHKRADKRQPASDAMLCLKNISNEHVLKSQASNLSTAVLFSNPRLWVPLFAVLR